jgi:hydroxyethylthiazole kinase-like uncharacterized protein yjeF
MKILSAPEIREWDLYTLEHEPIASIELMERASFQCTKWLVQQDFIDRPIKIFCGKGNNGGDGLAIACQLAEKNIIADVYILEFGAIGTDDFQQNLSRLHAYPNQIHFIQDASFFPAINSDDVVIDALYGSGVNRPLQGLSGELVQHINNAGALTISIDLPSGMISDGSSLTYTVIKASHTLTFQILKLCFLLPENERLFGNVHVLEIGLHSEYYQQVSSPFLLTESPFIKQLYKPRKKFAHKGNYGHSLIIAGEKGKMGAAVLTARACLRAGAGLVTTCINEELFDIIQIAVPEAMVMSRTETVEWNKYACVAIGPGLGTSDLAVRTLEDALQNNTKPMVVDADGLNILSANQHLLEHVSANSILTPHPKEFERLFGKSENDYERLQLAIRKSAELQVFIVLKGHRTAVACPDGQVYFNSTGNAGMATAGSGDVLTGIITGLLSQQYAPRDAAVLGVYLHGLAGEYAAKHYSQEAMIAGDIIKCLGEAYRQIAAY